MTLHFTYEGDSAEVGGRVFRFSKELGRRETGKGFKFTYYEPPIWAKFGSLQLTVKEATDVK